MSVSRKNRSEVMLQNAIGDWTLYKPAPALPGRPKLPVKAAFKLSERELLATNQLFISIFEDYLCVMQKNIDLPLSLQSCSVEIMNFPDVLKEVTLPVVQFKASFQGSESVMLCFDMNFASAMINAAVGSEIDTVLIKALTEIEESILESAATAGAEMLMPHLTGDFAVKFMNYPKVVFDQSFGNNSVFAFVECGVEFSKGLTGKAFLLLPHSVMKEMLAAKTGKAGTPNFKKLPVAVTSKINMDVTAVLGTSTITAKELYDLQEGDVIIIDNQINNLLHLNISEHLNLLGQPGIKENRLSLQIMREGTSRVEKIKESVAVAPPLVADAEPVREDEVATDEESLSEEEMTAQEVPSFSEENTEEIAQEEVQEEVPLEDLLTDDQDGPVEEMSEEDVQDISSFFTKRGLLKDDDSIPSQEEG